MIRQFFPIKDATIYENNELLNTGIDQILEIGKEDYFRSRILIQFDVNEINQYIQNNNILNYSCNLNLTSLNSYELPIDYTIYVHPLSQSWDMGIGKKNIIPIVSSSVNWIYRTDNIWNGSTANISGNLNDFYKMYDAFGELTASYNGNINGTINGIIYSESVLIQTDNIYRYFNDNTNINELIHGRFAGNIQAQYSGSINAAISGSGNISYSINTPGGAYISNIYQTQSFTYNEDNIDINITPILQDWISGSYTNHGLIIKLSDTLESQSNQMNLQFYSRDTHTIYPPKLQLYWDDSTFITSSNISNYTMSYTINTYQQSNEPISDLSFAYVNFPVPNLPRNATYTINDIWTSQVNPITQSHQDYIKTYVSTYLNGNINANVNGIFIGNITGSISGSNVSGGYAILSGSINEDLNGKLIAYIDGNFTGYINGNINDRVNLYEYYITGSRTYYISESINLEPLTKSNIILYIQNPLLDYKEGSINEIRVIGRERFPAKTYWYKNTYSDIKYLPTSSYYSIKDVQTEDIVIPFDDNATKLSCDENGNYFILDTTGFQTERMYRFIFKIVRNNIVQYFDDNFLFKITR